MPRTEISETAVLIVRCVSCGNRTGFGVAAGREHVVAAREQLADEFEPEPAVGSGDEDATHAVLRGENASLGPACRFPCIRFAL